MPRIISAVFISLISFYVNAQLLWQIYSNDTFNIPHSYILGTHHIAPVSILDSINGFEQALNDCEAVYGEVVINELTDASAQQKTITAAIAPVDSTLKYIFTPQQYDSINRILQELTGEMLSLNQLSQFKPAFINSQIATLIALKDFPQYTQAQQLDIIVQNRALAMKKSVYGLESLDSQINLFFNYPISIQAQELLETTRNFNKEVRSSKAIASAYLSQNIDSIWQIINDPELGLDSAEKFRLLDRRNQNWVSTLIPILKHQSILICVGAGHLPGPTGLITLLRNNGFTVNPL